MTIDRSAAVNLASNIVGQNYTATHKGVLTLCRAVLEMDKYLKEEWHTWSHVCSSGSWQAGPQGVDCSICGAKEPAAAQASPSVAQAQSEATAQPSQPVVTAAYGMNEQILAKAKETHDAFYAAQTEALKDISAVIDQHPAGKPRGSQSVAGTRSYQCNRELNGATRCDVLCGQTVCKALSESSAAEAPAHNDHPLRHWDMTCPRCQYDGAADGDTPETDGKEFHVRDYGAVVKSDSARFFERQRNELATENEKLRNAATPDLSDMDYEYAEQLIVSGRDAKAAAIIKRVIAERNVFAAENVELNCEAERQSRLMKKISDTQDLLHKANIEQRERAEKAEAENAELKRANRQLFGHGESLFLRAERAERELSELKAVIGCTPECERGGYLRSRLETVKAELAELKRTRHEWKDLSATAIMADAPSVREYVKSLEKRFLSAEEKLRDEIEMSAILAGQVSKAEREFAAKDAEIDGLQDDAHRYRWILTKGKITDFIFAFLKSREGHVSNAIDAARAAAEARKV